jgi:hypothetical protein
MTEAGTSKSNTRSKIIAIILILAFLLIGSCVFHRFSRRKAKPPEERVAAAAQPSGGVAPAKTAAEVRPLPTPPQYEKWFIDSVKGAESGGSSAPDEQRIADLRSDRARAISNALPGVRTITEWTGNVRKVQTVPGGKAALVIELPEPTILLQTWGDPISDTGAGTLIDESSNLYRQLKAMKPGTPVSFSGEFLQSTEDWCKEGSKSPREGLTSPKFILRFSEVKSLRN